jgi:predicted DNA-binding protein
MKTRTNDQTLNIRIPNALHEQLKVVAETQYMPMSVMVRLALAEYVRTHATVALARVAVNPTPNTPTQTPQNVIRKPSEQDDDWGY